MDAESWDRRLQVWAAGQGDGEACVNEPAGTVAVEHPDPCRRSSVRSDRHAVAHIRLKELHVVLHKVIHIMPTFENALAAGDGRLDSS